MTYLYKEPTFEEYVAARKVVLYVYEQLRQEKYKGHLIVASDEMVARIVLKSCERYRRMPVASGIYASEIVVDTLAHVVAVLKETRNPNPLPQLSELVEFAINDGSALVEILRSQAKEVES